MTQAFVYVAANAAAQENVKRSVQNPIPLSAISVALNAADLESLASIERAHGGLWCWGSTAKPRNKSTWDAMEPADWALCGFAKGFQYGAQIVWKLQSAAVANAIWGKAVGEGVSEQSFELIYFMTRPMKVFVPYETATGSIHHQGFAKLALDRLAGSEGVDAFIRKAIPALAAASDANVVKRSAIEAELAATANTVSQENNVSDPADARRKVLAEIVRRQGQGKFRAGVLSAYQRKCPISHCDAAQALEAAHIQAYLGPHTNAVSNGLLLRSDLHTLFDLFLITVDVSAVPYRVLVSPSLAGTVYARFANADIYLPMPLASSDAPRVKALKEHRRLSGL